MKESQIQKWRREAARAAAAAALATVTLLAAGAAAKDGWKKKPAGEWTREEAVEFLTRSPWAKEVEVWQLSGRQVRETVRQQTRTYSDAPGTEPPVTVSTATSAVAAEQVEARYRVAWTSAQIVRRGWERLQQIDPTLAEQFEPPEASPMHHIVTVRVTRPPEDVPVIFAGLSLEELRARAALQLSKKRTLAAERAVVHGTGAAQAVSFYFPREESGQATLAGADSAEFVFESPAGDRLKHKFKLKDMAVGGKAEY